MEIRGNTYGIGHLLCLIILMICVLLSVVGQTLSPLMVLALIGGLALALLL